MNPKQPPTFKHLALEQLADVIFAPGKERQLLMKGTTPLPQDQEGMILLCQAVTEARRRMVELEALLAFATVGLQLQPNGIEIDWHEEEG